MHVLIIYAHPVEGSFTSDVLKEFKRGLEAANHTYEVNDLYKTGFQSTLDSNHYQREMSWGPDDILPDDVLREHEKIQKSDAVVYIYPVWWSDCPALLKGWFDRVWTNGFAYSYEADSRKSLIKPKVALVLCTAGHTVEHLEETGIAESMRCIMINDRLKNVGFVNARMVLLGGTVKKDDSIIQKNLELAYENGLKITVTLNV